MQNTKSVVESIIEKVNRGETVSEVYLRSLGIEEIKELAMRAGIFGEGVDAEVLKSQVVKVCLEGALANAKFALSAGSSSKQVSSVPASYFVMISGGVPTSSGVLPSTGGKSATASRAATPSVQQGGASNSLDKGGKQKGSFVLSPFDFTSSEAAGSNFFFENAGTTVENQPVYHADSGASTFRPVQADVRQISQVERMQEQIESLKAQLEGRKKRKAVETDSSCSDEESELAFLKSTRRKRLLYSKYQKVLKDGLKGTVFNEFNFVKKPALKREHERLTKIGRLIELMYFNLEEDKNAPREVTELLFSLVHDGLEALEAAEEANSFEMIQRVEDKHQEIVFGKRKAVSKQVIQEFLKEQSSYKQQLWRRGGKKSKFSKEFDSRPQ